MLGVIHQGQRMTLCFESFDELARVHSCFDNLECYLTLQRLSLLGQENYSHAAFANLFKESVWPDNRADIRADGLVNRRSVSSVRGLKKTAVVVVGA